MIKYENSNVSTNYVGLVTGTCSSEMGVDVTCVDVLESKIDNLKKGIIPIYEPELEGMVFRNYNAEHLRFTTGLKECLDDIEVVSIAVGTPPDENGNTGLKCVLEVARTIGRYMSKYLLIVAKSTMPLGTAQKVRSTIHKELARRNVLFNFDVTSNPEFLGEGDAVTDFMESDRVVVGVDSDKVREIMERLYKLL